VTKDKQFKAEVRRYAEEHGLAYADARRQVLEATSVRYRASEGSVDLQGAEVSAEVMELLVKLNATPDEPPNWDERLSA
jgi:hypothetical protein